MNKFHKMPIKYYSTWVTSGQRLKLKMTTCLRQPIDHFPENVAQAFTLKYVQTKTKNAGVPTSLYFHACALQQERQVYGLPLYL